MPVVWSFDGGGNFFAQVEDGTLGKCDQGAGLEAGTKGGNPALARHALAVSSSKAKNPRGFGGQRPPAVATCYCYFTQHFQCLLLLTTNPKFVSF
jgi:hypothetical protein